MKKIAMFLERYLFCYAPLWFLIAFFVCFEKAISFGLPYYDLDEIPLAFFDGFAASFLFFCGLCCIYEFGKVVWLYFKKRKEGKIVKGILFQPLNSDHQES